MVYNSEFLRAHILHTLARRCSVEGGPTRAPVNKRRCLRERRRHPPAHTHTHCYPAHSHAALHPSLTASLPHRPQHPPAPPRVHRPSHPVHAVGAAHTALTTSSTSRSTPGVSTGWQCAVGGSGPTSVNTFGASGVSAPTRGGEAHPAHSGGENLHRHGQTVAW